jgi:hypothetical protein
MSCTRRVIYCLCLVLFFAPGCRRGPQGAPEADRPQALARLAGQYIARNRGQPPKNPDQLKAFARKLAGEDLQRIGIDPAQLDEFFFSKRDGKPFVFRDLARLGKAAGPNTVVLYEQEGSGGKRIVVFPTGQAEEADAARFKELVPEAP